MIMEESSSSSSINEEIKEGFNTDDFNASKEFDSTRRQMMYEQDEEIQPDAIKIKDEF